MHNKMLLDIDYHHYISEMRLVHTRACWAMELKEKGYMFKDEENNIYYKFPDNTIKTNLAEAWSYMHNNNFHALLV